MITALPNDSYLRYKRARYLKIALAVIAIALVVHLGFVGMGRRNTVFGWTSGALSGGLMFWLAWFGVRKRSYWARGAPLRGWLSAHVYLGLTLPILAGVHSAWRFGPNVHTLAWVLILLTTLAGIVGVILYRVIPQAMGQSRTNETLPGLLQRVRDLDGECESLARELPATFASAVELSIEESHIGGGLVRQLRGSEPNCGTDRALALIQDATPPNDDAKRQIVKTLLRKLATKRAVLGRIRTRLRYKAWLNLWLLFHVPLSWASLTAVVVHVFVIVYM